MVQDGNPPDSINPISLSLAVLFSV